jgi:hypothetical protein
MKKEFIPYEQALALKELGFDNETLKSYDTSVVGLDGKYLLDDWYDVKRVNTVKAPLYQQAFDWFRKKHNLYAEISLDSYREPYELKVIIKKLDPTNTFVTDSWYPYQPPNGLGGFSNQEYPLARLECLKKLIEIVKNK